jgi:tRNA (guanine37-N1)-methyltransferase
MDIAVLTIFPTMFDSLITHGMVKRAVDKQLLSLSPINIRDFTSDRHRTTDDRPYGGGCGMVMKPDPLAGAIRSAKKKIPQAPVIQLTPQGRSFSQSLARELVSLGGMILVCGRYEGIDERISLDFIDDEISIGDYILTGGELAAMVVIDAIIRLIPGVLGGSSSAEKESFADNLLEHGHYTRPAEFEGRGIPKVLQSGNHREIDRWRLEASLIRTFLKRKDLLGQRILEKEEIAILKKWALDIEKIIHGQSVCGADTSSGNQ